MDLELEAKRAVVLAGSSGLGRAVATELVAEGAHVIITSSSEENLQTATAEIQDETGCDPSAISYRVCDLTDPDSIESGVTDSLESLGGLDILITNHGGPPSKRFAETALADFDESYQAILRSTVQACSLAVPELQKNGGAIINLVAASTLESNVPGSIANVIRPGIYGLSKQLANEFGEDGVRVNCVSPRGVHTGRIEHKIELLAEREGISLEEAEARREAELPISRLGTPAEFGRAVAFLASPAAGFITGSVLPVDGGWSKHGF